jgi:hypothetical protein
MAPNPPHPSPLPDCGERPLTPRSRPGRTRGAIPAELPITSTKAGGPEIPTPTASGGVGNASTAGLSSGPSRGTSAVLAAQKAARLENRDAFSWSDRVLKPLEARDARAEAERLLAPEGELQPGGGEVGQRPSPGAPWDAQHASMIDTLEHPNMIGVEASEQRTADLQRVDILALALDAAVTAQASNSLEKMLCHQMAAAHHAAMRLLGDALGDRFRALPPVELVRLTNGAARLMDVFQAALVTLQRARTGGRQEVTVQHVHVTRGGQAVITGTIRSRKGGGTARGEK